jgi:hypothetical protein
VTPCRFPAGLTLRRNLPVPQRYNSGTDRRAEQRGISPRRNLDNAWRNET